MEDKVIKVVGAAIMDDDKVFTVQRSSHMTLSGLWEFPGGKIEQGESKTEALVREIKEEFDTTIKILDYIDEAQYDYSFGSVHLTVYTAEILEGSLQLSEHSDHNWVEPSKLLEVNWAPVDIPIAQTLSSRLKNRQ